MLKKQQEQLGAKALKALALIRLKRGSEAEALIDEVEAALPLPDHVLSALAHCFKVHASFPRPASHPPFSFRTRAAPTASSPFMPKPFKRIPKMRFFPSHSFEEPGRRRPI